MNSETPPGEATALDWLLEAWDHGARPELRTVCLRAQTLSPADAARLLRADQRRRWDHGARIPVETYLERCPLLRAAPDDAVDLIYAEFLLCERRGEQPTLAAYLERFPNFAALLGPQIQLHAAMSHDEVASTTVASRNNCKGYELLEELGRGGMGIVYRARQPGLRRLVALKVLRAGSAADPAQQARFQAEAEAVARLEHPNIVRIYEVGAADGQPFLALELMAGGSLKERLRAEPPPFRDAAALLQKVAGAVDYAHRCQVVHRDLKPANILLTAPDDNLDTARGLADVTPKIADFGLAKRLRDSPDSASACDSTQAGTVMGTPAYMAPEQAAGKGSTVGPAADVYALGAILYELLTGRPPFQGETSLATLQLVLEQEPVPPSRLRPGLPRDLETMCLKCLEKQPSRRYASAADLAEDLRRFQAGEPIAARPVSGVERLWRWCHRNPRAAGLLSLIACLVLCLLAGAVLWSLDRGAALERALSAEADITAQLYEARVAQAQALSLSRRPGQRFTSLAILDEATRQARARTLEPAHLVKLRNHVLAALALPDLEPQLTAVAVPADLAGAAFDERLEIVALTDAAGVCTIRRVRDGAEVYPRLIGAGHVPRLSRDGRFLAVIDQRADGAHAARVWQLGPDGQRLLLRRSNVHATAFHPSGAAVALADRDGKVAFYDLPSGKQRHELTPDGPWRELAIALHPTQPLVALGSYFAPVVQVRAWRTGAVVQSLAMPNGTSDVAWHPSGRLLAASDGDGPSLRLFDLDSPGSPRVLGPVDGGTRLTFNHAGDRLATAGWGTKLRLFDVGTGAVLFDPAVGSRCGVLRLAADDARLAGYVENGRLGVWQLADGREYRTLPSATPGLPNSTLDADVHPAGRLLAVATVDGILFWDLATSSRLGTLPLTGARYVHFDGPDALVTIDLTGTYRWPLGRTDTSAGSLRVGPPQPLPLPPAARFARSRAGRVRASAARAVGIQEPFAGAWILHAERPETPLVLDAGTDVGHIAVSPDGAWVVTVAYHGGAVKVWHAATGRLERQLLDSGGGDVQFSADGGLLAVGGAAGRSFTIGTWQEQRPLGKHVRFAPDGRTVAIRDGACGVRLHDLQTGADWARLDDPRLDAVHEFFFSADGTQLITLNDARGLHVWDLDLLRRQLASRDLDWDAPPYLARRPATDRVPLRLVLDRGDHVAQSRRALADGLTRAVQAAPHLAVRWFHRGQLHQADGHTAAARADLCQALVLSPNYAPACERLAWLYATAPPPQNDAAQAVALAERAVKLRPGDWRYVATLGVCHYRAGRYGEACAALERSIAKAPESADALELGYVALCHARLGHRDQACAYRARASAWHRDHRAQLSTADARDLRQLNAELNSVLGPANAAQ